jgi:polysaccharide export outer membrane protein
MRLVALIVASVLAAGLAPGCINYTPLPEETAPQPIPFKLAPGDRVRVSVWQQPTLAGDYAVGPDGLLTMPLAGSVPVKGLALKAAAEKLAEKLKEFVLSPTVTVVLLESKSYQVHVVGEVGDPGPVPYREGMTVFDAIQEAGSYIHAFADTDDCRLIRGRLDKPTVHEVDLEALFAAEVKDIYVRPGDIVLVPPRTVTSLDRYVRQLLSPLSATFGTAGQAGQAGLAGGTGGASTAATGP